MLKRFFVLSLTVAVVLGANGILGFSTAEGHRLGAPPQQKQPERIQQQEKKRFDLLPEQINKLDHYRREHQQQGIGHDQRKKLVQAATEELLNLAGQKETSLELQQQLVQAVATHLPKNSLPTFRRLLETTKYQKVKESLIYLICLHRDPADLDRFKAFLDSEHLPLRIAAIDAIGILRKPVYRIEPFNFFTGSGQAPVLKTNPKVPFASYATAIGWIDETHYQTVNDVPLAIRTQIASRMVSGVDAAEREAAARFLIGWPDKNVKLRLVEWGVWFQAGENLALTKSLPQQIPPFVHRIGDGHADWRRRMVDVIIIDKPVIHLTSNLPVAVDLEVQINRGRPWFVYPQPNDLSVLVQQYSMFDLEEKSFDPKRGVFFRTKDKPLTDWQKKFQSLDPKDGVRFQPKNPEYPFITATKRVGFISGSMGAAGHQVHSVGARWNSVVVCPNRQPWMHLKDVDDKFSWWKDLRNVNSSWVTSCDETERFLYYDGPTLMPAPFLVSHKDGKLTIKRNKSLRATYEKLNKTQRSVGVIANRLKPNPTGKKARVGVFLMVEQDGEVSAKKIVYSDIGGSVKLESIQKVYKNEKAVTLLKDLLMERGFTDSEAQGLIDSWKGNFFKQPGKRFVQLMSRGEYDSFCPIGIRPTPQQHYRVGLVLTEFDQSKKKK